MTPDSTESALLADLERRLELARTNAVEFAERWNQVSNVRLVLAAIAVGLGFWWLRTGEDIWGLLALVALLGFIAVMIWHQRLRARRDWLDALVAVRARAIARVGRIWADLPQPAPTDIPLEHPFANDLDLDGHGSLLHLMDITTTPAGRSTLRRWLLDGRDSTAIDDQQHVARELVPERDWREGLEAAGHVAMPRQSGSPEALVRWFEDVSHERIGVRHIVAGVLAVVTLVALVLTLAGAIAFALVLPLFLVNGVLSFLLPRSNRVNELNTHQRAIRQYRHVLPIAEAIPGSSAATRRLREAMVLDGAPASKQLARVDRALSLVIPPGTMLWVPLQLTTNWDILVDARLISIARAIGPHLRGWFRAIGEVEASSALAGLQDLNPTWIWPGLNEPGSSLSGIDVGHPLLPATRRVANDVTVGPPGRVLIVTGSNMAGKSTLLRSIGLNCVLARGGGPVCANALSIPNQPVWSSVRIQDSLEHGVSLYMAELLRLKAIVDAAEAEPITYLLDEILHGTNTTERRIAARTVIGRLLRTRSIGCVSTHDLELVDDELGERATCVHLVDQVTEGPDGPEMTFDYRLRPGLAPSSNALRLLNLVGLGEEPAR